MQILSYFTFILAVVKHTRSSLGIFFYCHMRRGPHNSCAKSCNVPYTLEWNKKKKKTYNIYSHIVQATFFNLNLRGADWFELKIFSTVHICRICWRRLKYKRNSVTDLFLQIVNARSHEYARPWIDSSRVGDMYGYGCIWIANITYIRQSKYLMLSIKNGVTFIIIITISNLRATVRGVQ